MPTAMKVGVKDSVGRTRPPEEGWWQLRPSQAEKQGGELQTWTKQDAPGPSPSCAADGCGAAGTTAGEEAAWSFPLWRGLGEEVGQGLELFHMTNSKEDET